MTHDRRKMCLGVLLATLLCPAVAAAMEDAGRRSVAASGEATVRPKAAQMRLQLPLIAKGKTMGEALAKLKERQEAATTQLESLKADKKSIVFGSPTLYNDQSSRKQQIQAMVIAQMKSRGKKVPKGLVSPQTVTVAATLTARWPLPADSPEKLLVFLQEIQEKVKAADLAGAKEAEKLTPEEEEFEEEASQMQAQYGNDGQQPGQPQFIYVAAISKQQRQKALADAFAKAKRQAADLAKAAGVELGPLVTLTGGANRVDVDELYGRMSYGRYGVNEVMAPPPFEPTDDPSEEKEEETIGPDPSTLKFTCRVMATFQLGK